MSQAFPKELLAKSAIAPIICGRSRASKLDDISAKASMEVLCRGHAGVPARSPSRGAGTAGPGRQRAGIREPALGLPTQAGGRGGMRKALWRDLKHQSCISEILQATQCI